MVELTETRLAEISAIRLSVNVDGNLAIDAGNEEGARKAYDVCVAIRDLLAALDAANERIAELEPDARLGKAVREMEQWHGPVRVPGGFIWTAIPANAEWLNGVFVWPTLEAAMGVAKESQS